MKKKLGFKKKTEEQPRTEKEKVEQRRAEVLAQGRKFKYPIQYEKHKIVIITIAIATVAAVSLTIFTWADFYKIQDTGDITYRVSRVLPIYVADVDGEKVRFSDYLMLFRSSMKAVEQQSGKLGSDDDAEYVRDRYKVESLNNAEKYTYAIKLGKELGIEVSQEEMNTKFDDYRKVGGTDRSEAAFLKVISDNFGLSKDEYLRQIYLSLMKEKVEENIDENAVKVAEKVESLLKQNGGDYKAVGESLGGSVVIEETGGLVDNKNIDGGRANIAASMKEGEQSGRFVSNNGDGYYFVKLLSKTETKVNYISIKVPFTEFEKRFSETKDSGKITEYIKIGESEE